jgi:predicted GNAT family acetyltransferase
MTLLLKTALDNPIWSALTSHQAYLAEGGSLARRYPADIGPLAAMESPSEQAYEALARLAQPHEQLVLFLEEPATPPAGWHVDVAGQLTQMVLDEAIILPESEFSIHTLTDEDVPEMLALTKLTRPGPFERRTRQLGTYLGIRKAGRLAAMAGERMHLEGYTEISAVCTHPDFQGKGYARALIAAVAKMIRERGETPFLHAWIHNTNAIRVYEKFGFRQRRHFHLAVLRKPD